MTLDDVLATVPVANAVFFILQNSGTYIAGAMVYNVADGIMQIIYWNDRPGTPAYLPHHCFITPKLLPLHKRLDDFIPNFILILKLMHFSPQH